MLLALDKLVFSGEAPADKSKFENNLRHRGMQEQNLPVQIPTLACRGFPTKI